jgi:predicted dehydrogenase
MVGETGEAYYEGRMTRGSTARFRIAAADALVRDEQRSPTADYVESFFLLEREFVDAVIQGRPAMYSAGENLESLKMTFAAYEAARTGQPVDLAEFSARSVPVQPFVL